MVSTTLRGVILFFLSLHSPLSAEAASEQLLITYEQREENPAAHPNLGWLIPHWPRRLTEKGRGLVILPLSAQVPEDLKGAVKTVAEPLRFLAENPNAFDTIVLVNTPVAAEEALALYWEHVAVDGSLIFESSCQEGKDSPDFVRWVGQAMHLLPPKGLRNPENHVLAYRFYPQGAPCHTVAILHHTPIDEEKINSYVSWAGRVNFLEGKSPGEGDKVLFSYLPHETLETPVESLILKRVSRSKR